MTKKTTIDPVFAAYTRTAPLGDLQFYLRWAERKIMTLELSEQTVGIAREMVALERVLLLGAGTPASNKARAWAMIDRFRSSIPGWSGHAGAKGSWVEPVDSDDTYWRARRALTMIDIIEPVAEPPLDYTPGAPTRKKKTPAEPAPEPTVRSVETEGPVTFEQVVAWHKPASDEAARLSGFGVPQRVEPLTLDAAHALLAEGLPERPVAAQATKPARVRQQPAKQPAPVVATLPCPSCRAPLTALTCSACKTTWTLQPARPARARRVFATVAGTVQEARPDMDGTKTCIRCTLEQPIDQYTYADGGRTVRNVCRTCHKTRQRERRTPVAA